VTKHKRSCLIIVFLLSICVISIASANTTARDIAKGQLSSNLESLRAEIALRIADGPFSSKLEVIRGVIAAALHDLDETIAELPQDDRFFIMQTEDLTDDIYNRLFNDSHLTGRQRYSHWLQECLNLVGVWHRNNDEIVPFDIDPQGIICAEDAQGEIIFQNIQNPRLLIRIIRLSFIAAIRIADRALVLQDRVGTVDRAIDTAFDEVRRADINRRFVAAMRGTVLALNGLVGAVRNVDAATLDQAPQIAQPQPVISALQMQPTTGGMFTFTKYFDIYC
jgi:hypothetical protein